MLIETILGGLTGIIGTALTSIMNFKTQKLKNEHEINLIRAQTAAMIEESKAQIEITKTRIEGAVELADADAYIQSIKEGNKSIFNDKWIDNLFAVQGKMRYISVPVAVLIAFLFGFIEWVKQFMRPGLTAYLVIMTSWITFVAKDILTKAGVGTGGITGNQAYDIFIQVIGIVIYLTVSCVTWWFGDRRVAKFLMRLNDGNSKSSAKK
jgi:hypothetical protein